LSTGLGPDQSWFSILLSISNCNLIIWETLPTVSAGLKRDVKSRLRKSMNLMSNFPGYFIGFSPKACPAPTMKSKMRKIGVKSLFIWDIDWKKCVKRSAFLMPGR
jgi:hypothetical protein